MNFTLLLEMTSVVSPSSETHLPCKAASTGCERTGIEKPNASTNVKKRLALMGHHLIIN
jgi:hypothetical protein